MNDKIKPQKNSPLYTSKIMAATKAALVDALGKDKDGAYRAYNRLDKQG